MLMLFSVLIASAAAGLASAPHCAMTCGPLVFSACGTSQGAGARYGVGRFIANALTGSIAGALGAAATRTLRTASLQRAVSLFVATGIALATLRLWRMTQHSNGLLALCTSRAAPTLRPWRTGLATGLLPCGSLLAGPAIAAGLRALGVVRRPW
jgi:sulfite exporter TauE/SafE